jgi:hypothetical protein
MASTLTLKAIGLNTNPNQLDLPEGSLIEAHNVIIDRENVIEPRRGFRIYGESFGSTTDRAKQMWEYKNRIIRHYSNKLEFQNGTLNDGTVNFDEFAGTYSEAEAGLRIKHVDSSGNSYFTTSDGIKKISAKLSSDLRTTSGFIKSAGGLKAVDFKSELVITANDQSAFLPQDSAVAYRVLWLTRDANDNLIRGAPSQREEVYNSLSRLLVQDFLRTLLALDNVANAGGSLITDTDYVNSLKVDINATAIELQTALLALAEKIDQDFLLANNSGTGASLNIDDSAAIAQIETVTTTADTAGSLNNNYFDLYSANGNEYYVWLNVNSAGTDPAVAGKTGIQVPLATGATAPTVATAIAAQINVVASSYFTASALGNIVTINHVIAGVATPAFDINTPFTFAVTTAGTDGLSHAISSDVYTVTFSSGNPSTYLSVGDKIYLTGFTPESGTLDGLQTVAAVTSTTLSINTENVTGPVAVGASAKIESGKYRNIEQPEVPQIPTPNSELVALQDYLDTIISELSLESTAMISSASQTDYIEDLDITTTASVELTITIPQGADSNYFFQIYRSGISQATGAASIDDIVPSDELQLVYEAYPTADELTASEIVVQDITPDDFRGANLYTNSATGEGILQANDLPPFALDINRFKNVTFFANTRTRHRKSLNLVGVQQMIDEYDGGTTPKLTIVTEDGVNTYNFVTGIAEEIEVECTDGSTLAASGTASYFLLSSAGTSREYYVWYKIGTATDPALAGKTGIRVVATAVDTDVQIAEKTRDALNAIPLDFISEVTSGSTVGIVLTEVGYTSDAAAGTSGFTVTVVTQGRGEDASIKQVLLSPSPSVATAVDETARSLVRVINKNASEQVYAYYLSGPNDVPGQVFLEAKGLEDVDFYVTTNSDATGTSFTPDLSPSFSISSIALGTDTTVVTTSAPHGYVNNDVVVISLTNSTPSLDGIHTIRVLSSTTFEIAISAPITIAGTSGIVIHTEEAVVSENERKVNRIYYSKISQPEAVPLLNYLEVGDSDKSILRIFPLRDSLFVFKEDGLYRISGEVAPFTVSLFDSSCILNAPDTLDVSNNSLYGLTTQGVAAISEGGVENISLAIDEKIARLMLYTEYATASFGIGYESDSSYTLYSVQADTEENATIGYRYSIKTGTWTTLDRDATCGFVNPVDDRSYFGAGDTNYIERERKNFNRLDYSDREIAFTLTANSHIGTSLRFTDVDDVEIGDVLAQTQMLTPYEFNMTLKKLDNDPGVADDDYFETLEAVAGDSMRLKIEALATKLDADTGVTATTFLSTIETKTGTATLIDNAPGAVITSASHELVTGRYVTISSSDSTPDIDGTWEVTVTGANNFTIEKDLTVPGTTATWTTADTAYGDIRGCFNKMMDMLNQDAGVGFTNYKMNDTETTIECIVTAIDRIRKTVTVNLDLDFIQGPMTLYKGIQTTVTYGPTLFGDPINFKHLREASMMFINKAFTSAELAFATDLLPQFVKVPFNGDGNGIFGHATFGGGFFGGASHSAPFRTYVPRPCQRCRYILVRFKHRIARESYGIYGMSITGENTQSSRAYRG